MCVTTVRVYPVLCFVCFPFLLCFVSILPPKVTYGSYSNCSILLCLLRLRNFRSLDRKVNEQRYPALFYPEAYLLDGGYRNFFRGHSKYCEPHGYVEMGDTRFVAIYEDTLTQTRKSWKRHKSFSADGACLEQNSSAE